jgi:hypothetical protein
MGEPGGPETLMARELHRRLRQEALGAQEDNEAWPPAAAGHDGPWRPSLLEGGGDPRVTIARGGRREVLREGGLPGLGHQHRHTCEGAAGACLRRRRLVAGTQMDQIGRDQRLVLQTQTVQPTELREGVDHWGGL